MGENVQEHYEVLQCIQSSVVVHGPDTKIITCNKAAQELFGLTEEQMLGKKAIDPVWRLCDKDGKALQHSDYPVNKVLISRSPLKNFIVGIHRPDRVYVTWVLVHAVPEFTSDGRITRVIVTSMDITELRRVEAEREKLIKELQRALTEVDVLREILPICSFCKKIRDDQGYYERVESYIHRLSGVDFSHTVCPDCMKKYYPEEYSFSEST